MKNLAANNKTKGEWMTWLKAFGNQPYRLTQEESIALRDAIMTYEDVANEFFYKTLRPMILSLVNKVRDLCETEVGYYDIATIIYTEFYWGGKWTRLRTYEGRCSIFSWVARAASQIVFAELKRCGYINKDAKYVQNKTALTLKSIKNKEEREMIVDLVKSPQMHAVLSSLYVEQKNDEDIRMVLGVTREQYRVIREKAENALKEALISKDVYLYRRDDGNLVNLVSLAISDVSRQLAITTKEDAFTIAESNLKDDDNEFVKEALEECYQGMPWTEQWDRFLLDYIGKMKWKEEDQTIFLSRYINNESPERIAKRLGRSRPWVDTRYSQLKGYLVRSIKTWWAVQYA